MRLFIFVATTLLGLCAFADSRAISSIDDVSRKVEPEARRSVDKWDYERLSGYFEFEAREKKFEVDRMLGVDELKALQKKEELEQAKALSEFKIQSRKDERPRNDEDDPLYQAYLKEQANVEKQKEQNREKYLIERDQMQRSGKLAPVTEAQELKISENRERVDWRFRALYGGSASKPLAPRRSVLDAPVRGSGPSDMPFDPGGGFIPPQTDDVVPSFEGADPEIFDEDIPPPPPPPEGFDEMIPPPPPGLDETDF